jgi:hypothetical protein
MISISFLWFALAPVTWRCFATGIGFYFPGSGPLPHPNIKVSPNIIEGEDKEVSPRHGTFLSNSQSQVSIFHSMPSLCSLVLCRGLTPYSPALAAFKATGKGWQTRMNEALREWLKEHPMKQV